ncbi:MAG TPA: class I SAM-dependent methyltransferase [Bryobacteraceae bacterium]|nr:class I SAM-dependent methyltransferase [Bryobacteraceae bacterium]
MARRPNYGIDSPGIVAGLLIAGTLCFASAQIFPRIFQIHARWLAWIPAAYFLAAACGMLVYSKRGKLRHRDRILDSISWRGDERVLDVGCGRGLLLIGAAHHLHSGTAIGLDRWVPGAVSGNRPAAVIENAEIDGVARKVTLANGDARQLPFPDHAFDAVISNYLLHEVNTAAEREQIALEIVRVLKPGGHIAIADFIFTNECAQLLTCAGMQNVRRSRLGGLNFWAGAIFSFGSTQNYVVTGQKPAAAPPLN